LFGHSFMLKFCLHRAPLEGDDLEDYPDPLDPPPWIDVGEGRPKAINMTIAGPMLKRKMERKVKPRETSSEVKEEVKEEPQAEQGKDGPLWVPANVYDPSRHRDWEFKEEIPPYILAMHADPLNPSQIAGKVCSARSAAPHPCPDLVFVLSEASEEFGPGT